MDTTKLISREDWERLQALRYMDDDFMTICLADNFEGVELILRIILGRDDLTVISVRTQEQLKNLQGRSAVLDVHAIDSARKEFDIEIQRSDTGAGAKRARHNSSLLDAHILKPGEPTENFPDSYVIFITENDVLQGGQALYPVERYVSIGEEKVLFGDGSHIIYVNGKYRGDDAIGRLMHDFCCTNPDEMNYEALAKKARYLKQDEEGVTNMSKIIEDMKREVAEKAAVKAAKETSMQNAKRFLKMGKLSLEDIAQGTGLPFKEVEQLQAELMQPA